MGNIKTINLIKEFGNDENKAINADENITDVEAEIKEAELIPLSNAAMFGLVMAKEENCKVFIERTLGISITKLNVVDAEKTIVAGAKAKGSRLDVYAEDETGKAYDIEMQVKSDVKDYLGQRTRYYQSMMDTSLLKKGQDYWQLPSNYIIFVCTFDPFDENRKYYTFNNMCKENKDIELKDGCTKIFLNTKGCIGNISSGLDNVLRYIETEEPMDDYTRSLHCDVQLYSKDPVRRQAVMTTDDDERLLKYIIAKKDAEIADKDAVIADKDVKLAKSAENMDTLRAQLLAAGIKPAV